MRQVRYHLTAARPAAQKIFGALERAFEEEGAPLAIVEIDEAAEKFEISAYLDTPEGADRTRELADLATTAAGHPVEVAREEVPDVDWMAQVLRDLKPVRAGRFLVHGSHDRDKARPGDLAIEIDAGQAFGTGHHGTTAGCLEMIERVVRRRGPPRRALDLGTGSAVLAIGLAKLGRRPVLASDIDPVAVEVARENAARNGVLRRLSVVVAAGFGAPAIRAAAPFDLVVANILARPLQALAPSFARHLAPGGEAILSGILEIQRRAVLASFATQGLRHRETISKGEWVTLRVSR